MGCRGVLAAPGLLLNQYIVMMTSPEPVYRLGDHFWPSISSWYHYWTSISFHWPLMTQYIVLVTTFDPVFRHGDQYWTSISSWWPLLTQYIVSMTVICSSSDTDWGERTRSPYRGRASCLGSTAGDDMKGWASTQQREGWRRRQHKGVGVLRRTLYSGDSLSNKNI